MNAAQRKRKRRIEAAAAGMTPKQHRIARAVARDVTAILTADDEHANTARPHAPLPGRYVAIDPPLFQAGLALALYRAPTASLPRLRPRRRTR